MATFALLHHPLFRCHLTFIERNFTSPLSSPTNLTFALYMNPTRHPIMQLHVSWISIHQPSPAQPVPWPSSLLAPIVLSPSVVAGQQFSTYGRPTNHEVLLEITVTAAVPTQQTYAVPWSVGQDAGGHNGRAPKYNMFQVPPFRSLWRIMQ